jgi:hypothetical protein
VERCLACEAAGEQGNIRDPRNNPQVKFMKIAQLKAEMDALKKVVISIQEKANPGVRTVALHQN